MPSLHKDPRGKSPFWYCAFTLPNGQRAFRSTKTSKRTEAEAMCEKWQRQSRGLVKSPRLENKELVMERFIEATQKASNGAFGEAEARKMLDEILQSAGQTRMHSASIGQFFADWLESKKSTKAKGTAQRYRNVVEPFLAHLGAQRAGNSLANLTVRDMEGFRDLEVRAGKAAKTANMAVKTLRIALNTARRQGLILSNPAEAIDHLPENSAERGTFTPAQLAALLGVADEEWRGMILLGATCGLRLGDAARLTWANVDTARKVIHLHPQKTAHGARRKELEVPMLPDLENYLLALPLKSSNPHAPLFPALSRKKVTGRAGLSNTFTRLIGEAGIDNEAASAETHGKGRTVFRLGFHALRHTYVSIMANMGVSKELRMKLAGHTSNAHDRYSHHELETYREALKGFPSLASETGAK